MNLATLALPPWARIAWKFAPWIAIVALVAILMLGRARYQTKLARSATTIERLNGAVAAQNLAVDALNRQQVQAVAAREDAQRRQNEREAAQAGVRDRLARYQRPADGTACPNPAGDALAREMWGRL